MVWAGISDAVARYRRVKVAPRRKRLKMALPLVPALLGLISIAALDVFAVNTARPVAIIFPQGTGDDTAFAAIIAAGGQPIRKGRSRVMDGTIWVALGDSPDFPGRVRAAGAWLVVNPYAFGGCLITS